MQEKIPHTAVSISQGAFSAGEVHLDVVEPFLAEAVKLDHRNQKLLKTALFPNIRTLHIPSQYTYSSI